MKELFERIFSDTPAFFTKLKYIAGSLAAILTTVVATANLSESLTNKLIIAAAVCGAIAGTSQFAKKDPGQK